MEDLRRALRYGEFADVETVVASGNLLFDHEIAASEGIAEKMAWIIRDEFEIACFVTVRTKDELGAILADNPFAQDGDDASVHAIFLPDDPGAYQVKNMQIDLAARGNERIAAGPKFLYTDHAGHPDGAETRSLTSAFIARRLGMEGTSRDIRSMKRIHAKMEEQERADG